MSKNELNSLVLIMSIFFLVIFSTFSLAMYFQYQKKQMAFEKIIEVYNLGGVAIDRWSNFSEGAYFCKNYDGEYVARKFKSETSDIPVSLEEIKKEIGEFKEVKECSDL